MIKFLICGVLLFFSAAPLWGEETQPTPTPELNQGAEQAPEPSQQIDILVVDARHTPLPGVKLAITPQAGESLASSNILYSDNQGRITLQWRPLLKQDEAQSEDKLLRYIASFAWQADKAGYLQNSGSAGRQSVERHVASQELLTLDAMPAFPPMQTNIIMHQTADLFDLSLLTAKPELKRWCQAFYEENYQLAQALGTPFCWPAFAWQNGALVINLQYFDHGWAGTAGASLLHRATVTTYMPWWLLLKQSACGLPPTENIRLQFTSNKDIDPLDPHAWSSDLVLSATIPCQALSQLKNADLSLLAAQYPLQQSP